MTKPSPLPFLWAMSMYVSALISYGTHARSYLVIKIYSLLWHSHAGELCMATSSTSVQFSCSVVSDSLWPHELQHTRPPCPSPTPRVYQNPCPLSRWCDPTTSSSVIAFSSCLQIFPTSGSFLMSQFFASGGYPYLYLRRLLVDYMGDVCCLNFRN